MKKIVIEVQMNCDKCRKKAMKFAASTNGVNSISLGGEEKTQLIITGDGVDSVNLIKILRKKVGRANIAQLEEVKEEKKEKKEEESYQVPQWYPSRPIIVYDWLSSSNPSSCSIL